MSLVLTRRIGRTVKLAFEAPKETVQIYRSELMPIDPAKEKR